MILKNIWVVGDGEVDLTVVAFVETKQCAKFAHCFSNKLGIFFKPKVY